MKNNEHVKGKFEEATRILLDLGLEVSGSSPVVPLTLLALCNVKPDDNWEAASRQSMTISKDIMPFIEKHYGVKYAPNSRESFRKYALHTFLENNIAELNPDDPALAHTSAKTHYAITAVCLNTIRKYGQTDWEIAIENFKRFNVSQSEARKVSALLRSVEIRGFKSILTDKLQLGRVNVFIGSNGSGKTNILEAIGIASAARANDLNFEGFYSRGIRVARPDQLISSFVDTTQNNNIVLSLEFEEQSEKFKYEFSLTPAHSKDMYSRWIDLAEEELIPEVMLQYLQQVTKESPGLTGQDLLNRVNEIFAEKGLTKSRRYDPLLTEYSIFDLNTKSLRGITPAESKKTPLGINGEGLDLLISSFTKKERQVLLQCRDLFEWLDEVITDREDRLKLQTLKAGKSISTLYFKDAFMDEKNSILSAENSNEGILHVLFYLALFVSDKTPKLLAIDNVETALNPRLCRVLIEQIVRMCADFDKQVLITTHNPAILDGLDLSEDEQRLFEVYRDDEGHTRSRRIQFRKDLTDKSGLKLSEMWMAGVLGGIPRNF